MSLSRETVAERLRIAFYGSVDDCPTDLGEEFDRVVAVMCDLLAAAESRGRAEALATVRALVNAWAENQLHQRFVVRDPFNVVNEVRAICSKAEALAAAAPETEAMTTVAHRNEAAIVKPATEEPA